MFKRNIIMLAAAILIGTGSAATARFVGPSVAGREHTVAQLSEVRLGSYVTLSGHITEHLRNDFYTFRDDTGTIRVEIANDVWRGQDITPETQVRLLGEVDRGLAGRYVWVKSLSVAP